MQLLIFKKGNFIEGEFYLDLSYTYLSKKGLSKS